MLNQEQIARCKKLLQDRQHTLIEQLQDPFGQETEMMKESVGGIIQL